MKAALIGFGLALLSMTGCATINSPTPGDGTAFEVRGHGYAAIWSAAVRTLERRNLVIVTADRDGGVLRAENTISQDSWSWGQVVGVFIRPTTPEADRYVVEVQSLRRARYAFAGPDWTQTIITGMKTDLAEARQR